MSSIAPISDIAKVQKLRQIAAELHRGNHFNVTRLTVLKSLGKDPDLAHRFALYIAKKIMSRMKQGRRRKSSDEHKRLMTQALAAMKTWLTQPTEAVRERMWDLQEQMRQEQNEYRNVPFAAVRIIHDWNLFMIESAVECHLRPPEESGFWIYRLARNYAERYDSRYGTGLIPASAPFVQDVVDFWTKAIPGVNIKKAKTMTYQPRKVREEPHFTHRQGQFLAFLHEYRKLHRQAPAELDFAIYFRIRPPAVHGMMVKLEKEGLITRTPGMPRSAVVAIPEAEIPNLEEVAGPSW